MQFNYYNLKERPLKIKNNCLVPVIASFNSEGKCLPLYFRYTYADGQTIPIHIDKVLFSKPNACYGTIYCCQILVCRHKQIVYLFYHDEQRKWYLRQHNL